MGVGYRKGVDCNINGPGSIISVNLKGVCVRGGGGGGGEIKILL